jgi:predicted enzyme related to lactoylglutathione lyase
MSHPVVHVEIRSQDPDATRAFLGDLFGWKVAAEGDYPGYTFIDTGAEGPPHTAISPRQATEDEVLFFVGVEDVAATLSRAQELGGTVIQPAQHVPGTSFGVFADPQGHRIGVAAAG